MIGGKGKRKRKSRNDSMIRKELMVLMLPSGTFLVVRE